MRAEKKRGIRRQLTPEERQRWLDTMNMYKAAKLQDARDFTEKMKDGPEPKYVVEIDGKMIDYTEPIRDIPMDAHLFGDLEHLKRSNEIKELMKKKREEVFGIDVMDMEVRYCDVGHYDPKFELVRLERKNYDNRCDKKEYYASHPTEECKAQIVISDINAKLYDLGFECFDDYLDYRYQFAPGYKTTGSVITSKRQTCGVDGCIFQTCYEDEMEEHKRRHNEDLPFVCKDPNCKHKCKTRMEMKYHSIAHCKYMFLCPAKGCYIVKSYPVNDNHIASHLRRGDYKDSQVKSRFVCPLCRRMERNVAAHRAVHKEWNCRCPIPGCKYSCFTKPEYYLHGLDHFFKYSNK